MKRRCCLFCNDINYRGKEFGGKGFTFGICRECAIILIQQMMSELGIKADEIKEIL